MKRTFLSGLVLTITLVFAGFACNSNSEGNRNYNRANSTANQNTVDHSQMDHSQMDHSQMNHNAMNANASNTNSAATDHSMMNHAEMKTAPDAVASPYDLQFLDTMIAHHQGAVDMAKMIDGRTQNSDLKRFGASVIADQEKEIGQMREWREKWFAGKPSAMNMEMPGMKDSMKGMDMSKLGAAKDKAFDVMFVEMMIPHHEGAVTMAKEALDKAEHQEIKTLAQAIIMAQEAEIKTMQDWKERWSK